MNVQELFIFVFFSKTKIVSLKMLKYITFFLFLHGIALSLTWLTIVAIGIHTNIDPTSEYTSGTKTTYSFNKAAAHSTKALLNASLAMVMLCSTQKIKQNIK